MLCIQAYDYSRWLPLRRALNIVTEAIASFFWGGRRTSRLLPPGAVNPIVTPLTFASPLWVDVQKLCNKCAFTVIELLRITPYQPKPYKFPMHCSKCVSFWRTSYSRPPIHTSLPPCYKILAAPLTSDIHDLSQRNHILQRCSCCSVLYYIQVL